MALDADFVEHLLAGTLSGLGTVALYQAADGHDAGFGGIFGGFGNVAFVFGGGKFDQQEQHGYQNQDAAQQGNQRRTLRLFFRVLHLIGPHRFGNCGVFCKAGRQSGCGFFV